ncbi:MAG: amidohydrolase [Chloroflexi bacterium]|nr:amidohydrolase [Chloroflexota bacterium]
MLIVDTHAHVSPYWYEPVDTLLYEMNVNGVAKTVLVQIHGNYNNDYQLECLRRYPGRFASCVEVDTTREDAPAKLQECATKGASGVRLMATTRSPGSDEFAVWRKADELGLTVSVQGEAADFASDEFRRLVEMFPNLSLAIEHYGHPDRDERPPFPVYRRLLSLANYPNTYMKIGGLNEVCVRLRPFRQPNPMSEVPPFVKMAVEAFGPRRTMFGTNFPPVAYQEGYRNSIFRLMDYLSYLKQEDLEGIFGQTALQVWRFPNEQTP